MRRVLLAVAVVAGAFAIGAGSAPAVSADASSPPVVTHWSPQSFTSSAQPVYITLVGVSLTGVTQVFTAPIVTPRAVAVISDQAAVVGLPANLAPGTYDITLVSPSGTTQPGSIVITVLQAPPVVQPGVGLPGTAGITLQPAPAATDAPAVQAIAGGGRQQPATSSVVTQTRASVTESPFFALAVGIAVGGLLYALWGKEGRLRVARRRGLLAQLWARPLQRLKLARVCLHCGRLHYVIGTRRDLWSAGEFCSATCFVGDQEQAMATASAEGVAPTRLRGIGVYTDLEVTLKEALRAEASAHGASMFADEIAHQHNPAVFILPEVVEEAGAPAVDAPAARENDAPSGPAEAAAADDDDPIHVIAPPAIQLSA